MEDVVEEEKVPAVDRLSVLHEVGAENLDHEDVDADDGGRRNGT